LIDSSLQFHRDAEVIIGPRVSGKIAPEEPVEARSFRASIQNRDSDGKIVGGFRIRFNVEKEQTATANKAKITLYNVNQESRNFFEQKDLIIFLKAGYAGNVSTIFFGDIMERVTSRAGADITTMLECGDQEQILATANVQIGLGPGATNLQAFSAAESAIGLKIPALQKSKIPTKQFRNGFSFSGTAQELLRKLTEEINFRFSIQDGEIQVLSELGNDGDEAVLISPETGLIGFPTKTQEGIRFVSLLNPGLRPGRRCKVESKQFQGSSGSSGSVKAADTVQDSGQVITLKKVVFDGDTQEGPFDSKCEGIVPEGNS
jgi:hypothetical protein